MVFKGVFVVFVGERRFASRKSGSDRRRFGHQSEHDRRVQPETQGCPGRDHQGRTSIRTHHSEVFIFSFQKYFTMR